MGWLDIALIILLLGIFAFVVWGIDSDGEGWGHSQYHCRGCGAELVDDECPYKGFRQCEGYDGGRLSGG